MTKFVEPSGKTVSEVSGRTFRTPLSYSIGWKNNYLGRFG